MKKGFAVIEIIIALVIFAILASGVWVWREKSLEIPSPIPTPIDVGKVKMTTPSIPRDASSSEEVTKNWSNLIDPLIGLFLKYPSDYEYYFRLSPTLRNELRYYSLMSPCPFPEGDKRCLSIRDTDLKLEIYVERSNPTVPLEEQLKQEKEELIESRKQADIGPSTNNYEFKLEESSFTIDRVKIFRWEQKVSTILFAERDGYRIEIIKLPGQTSREKEYNQILATLRFLPEDYNKDRITIQEFVDKFEVLHQSKKAEEVLSLFTTPVSEQEVGTYSFLAGGDAAGFRLYATNTSNYKVDGYQVTSIKETNPNVFTVKIQERRASYNNVTGTYSPFTNVDLTMEVRLKYGEWLIESLTASGVTDGYGGLARKYSGLAQ